MSIDTDEEIMREFSEVVTALKHRLVDERDYGGTCRIFSMKGKTFISESPVAVDGGYDKSDVAAAPITLPEIRREIGDCQRCELGGIRTNLVFGEGDPNAALVFVGEAPGEQEDRQGKPFVGRAGQLLTRIIEAMGLKRSEVYICNILKCRPPGNRNPKPAEIAACEPFLLKQLDAIGPKVICALGTFAAKTLLNTDLSISVLRGRFHEYHGIKLMPTYHPAYLLRNPGAKKQVWEDVQMIMKELNIPVQYRAPRE
ncbi:MAG: uracil-DNA glycosylase [Deltaproteobacteria bacterium]|nr:uracil-DNA glycosylase [Deltaproteobacteria bacterium]